MEIKEKILEVLEKGQLMSLATVDDGGLWVADVGYTHDNSLNIYWISSPKVRHSVALNSNNQVAGSITVSAGWGEPNLGIQLFGSAQALNEVPREVIENYFNKREKPVPVEGEEALKGRSWYVLKPTKIDLIDEANQGYTKKSIEL